MDHTKNKTFIAFINQSGKDKWWIDGNCPYEVDRPKILPYGTAEEKETALLYGKTIGIWDEVTDVYGVLLKVEGQPFEIINRKDADAIQKEIKEKEEARKKEMGIESGPPASKKKKKKKDSEPKDSTPEPSKEVLTPKDVKVESISTERKKRGQVPKIDIEE